MGVSKEAFVDLQEKFEKVKKLIEEDTKLDPPNEPYKSKYAARNLLISMKKNIERLQENEVEETKDLLNSMLGIVWLLLGTISIDTEELATGETQLNTSLNIAEKEPLKPHFILIILNGLNQLGILWSNRDDAEKSKEYLTRADKIYVEFISTETIPISFSDIFLASGDRNKEVAVKDLEKTHTLTLYYLAQIYGSLKDVLKSAVYCHITLKRQLEYEDFEPIDWALNAATLSQCLMEQNGFKQARHHLAAASYMLNMHENKLNEITEQSEEHDAKIEIFKHRSADVARCWAKYGLLLLMSSRDRLLNHTDDDEICKMSTDLSKLELGENSMVSKEDLMNLQFSSLNLQTYEQQISDEFALTFDDARGIFLSTQSWLTDAQKYYTLENHASDYVQIVQDISHLYDYLSFFEDDPERQSKMHKRRIDILEKVLKELNPNYYMQVCRQIWFELGKTYNTNLEIKMDKLKLSTERPTPHALSKINLLCDKSIEHFQNFLNSLKQPLNDTMPEDIPEDYENAAVKAYFHIGVLYGRYLNPDKKAQLEYNTKSLEYFNKMIGYCDKHPKAQGFVAAELSVCREMASLLPFKIKKIKETSFAP